MAKQSLKYFSSALFMLQEPSTLVRYRISKECILLLPLDPYLTMSTPLDRCDVALLELIQTLP